MDLSQKTVRQLIEEVYGAPAPAEKSNSLMRSFSPGESFQLGMRFASASREFERLVIDALHDTHWWARAGTRLLDIIVKHFKASIKAQGRRLKPGEAIQVQDFQYQIPFEWADQGLPNLAIPLDHLLDTDSLPERLMLLSLQWLDSYFFATRTGFIRVVHLSDGSPVVCASQKRTRELQACGPQERSQRLGQLTEPRTLLRMPGLRIAAQPLVVDLRCREAYFPLQAELSIDRQFLDAIRRKRKRSPDSGKKQPRTLRSVEREWDERQEQFNRDLVDALHGVFSRFPGRTAFLRELVGFWPPEPAIPSAFADAVCVALSRPAKESPNPKRRLRMPDRLRNYSTKEAAEFLRLSPKTIHRERQRELSGAPRNHPYIHFQGKLVTGESIHRTLFERVDRGVSPIRIERDEDGDWIVVDG